MMKSTLIAILALACSMAWADITKLKYAANFSSTPYDVVAPLLGSDPATADRVAGQIYYTISNAEFRAIDPDGNAVTLGSVLTSQAPSITTYTSGSGTYTTPTGAKYLRIRMVGGGGGGAGSGTTAGVAAGSGTSSTINSTLIVAGGGSAGSGYSGGAANGGAGGTTSMSAGPSGIVRDGSKGQGGVYTSTDANAIYAPGGSGGATPFGGAGVGYQTSGAGAAAVANTGSGGSGGGVNVPSATSGGGGGAAGYADVLIANPASSYTYQVGSGGSAGGAGTSGSTGGAGGSGFIIIEAYFQ